MGNLLASTSVNWFNLLILILLFCLSVISIISLINVILLKKKYKILSNLLGNGQDFNSILAGYVEKVENVSRETLDMNSKINDIRKNMEKCVQKVGIVRYKAYLDSGSDLCFAVALLDFEDNGVVINGIYSRDNTTTTYAKPIEHGKSKYTLVDEEIQAIELAKHNGYKCFLNVK